MASAFFTFAGYAAAQSMGMPYEMRPGQIVAEVRTAGVSVEDLADRLRVMPGVRTVLPVSGSDAIMDEVPISQLSIETDGTAAVAERVRTAIVAEFPASWIRRTEELATA